MKDACAAISGGVFIDNPITLQSLKTSDTIYGTSVACLKGKTVHTPSEIEKIIEVTQDHSQKLRLYADILFVEGNPILLSSSDPIHLLIATSLSSRTSLSISKALNAHIAVYTQENFTISSILVDSESGLLSLREDYARQGIRVDTAPPGQHVPVIERKIRLVKERCRAIMSDLPCPLCRALLVALVLFVVSRINLLPVMGAKAAPHSWNRISPREALTGRKMSYTRDLRVGFLDYVQLVEPVNISTHNTLTPRTRGGVALQPLSNSSGAVKFLLLDTGAVVVRSKFTVLPMPDIVIKHLTALAAADKKTVSKNPLFQYHGRAIPDMINDEIQEGVLESDLDIDTTDPYTNGDVDVDDPRTQIETPITYEDSSTEVPYVQQYDFADEILIHNDALERIEDTPAPHELIDVANIGEPIISRAEQSTVDENDKVGINESTDDEG